MSMYLFTDFDSRIKITFTESDFLQIKFVSLDIADLPIYFYGLQTREE